jgi:DNA-binding CsgD family transcriptional regulator
MFSTFGNRLIRPVFNASDKRGIIERQRHAVFFFSSLGVAVLSIGLLIIGSVEIPGALYLSLFTLAVTMLLLYLFGKLPVTMGVAAICIVNQLLITLSMVLHAIDPTPHDVNVIIGDMVLSICNILVALGAYLKLTPYILASLILATYSYCAWVTKNDSVIHMIPIFFIPVVTLALIGDRLAKNVRRLEREKDQLKEDETKILNLFEMDKTQLMAYIALAKKKGLSFDETRVMLDSIGPQAKENIRDNVARWIRQSQIDYERLSSLLPGLTVSEIEICKLILQDKKLKEIGQLLKKSESNITCQRANIRSKLGLNNGENLAEALRRRVTDARYP